MTSDEAGMEHLTGVITISFVKGYKPLNRDLYLDLKLLLITVAAPVP